MGRGQPAPQPTRGSGSFVSSKWGPGRFRAFKHVWTHIVNFGQSCMNTPDAFIFYRPMHYSAKRGLAIACRLSVCL